MRVVIDHIAGSRAGQRQEFPAGERVRFGRHPDCEVSFDPHRDIDASSRHAELRPARDANASGSVNDSGGRRDATGPRSQAWVLVDLGSSNGTYVRLRAQHPLSPGEMIRMGDELLRFELG